MKKKVLAVIGCLGFIIILSIGLTTAYFTSQKKVENTLHMGKIDVNVTEKVLKSSKEMVGVTLGSESSKCWVRLYVGIPVGNNGAGIYDTAYLVNESGQWLMEDGTVIENGAWLNEDGTLVDTDKAFEGGWLYYNEPLSGGDSRICFKEIKAVPLLSPDDKPANLDVIVYTEGVQYMDGETDPIAAFTRLKQ